MCECFRPDILFFFDKHKGALPIYEQLELQIISLIPETKIKVSKTHIGFSLTYGYAFVSFNPCKKAAERPLIWLTVTFGLGYRKASSRIDAATEPYPNRWTYHVMVASADEIDDELLGWIREAASFSA